MEEATLEERTEFIAQALDHLRSALDLIDRAAMLPHVGAWVDLAIHDLYLGLAKRSENGQLDQFGRNAAPH
jgi:hypothetical protein